uniref:G-protein coupled receptors family 1 profile domain-containing protein n=1 Tax=Panagrolaimus sp. JU765 TaxID=591449 RepID=A0AC34QHC5_9BILA
MSTAQPIEYVAVGDTLADVALKDATSASLAATTSILLAILVVVSFILNLLLIATILSSYKLRTCVLYLSLCVGGIFNIFDAIFITFLSLLYVANTIWNFGDGLCRTNAFFQQFVFLKMIFLIVIMATERVATLSPNFRNYASAKCVVGVQIIFTAIAFAFAIPTAFNGFPVKIYRYRYLCAIGSGSPLAYNIIEILIYCASLIFILICFGYILKKGNEPRSLPVKPQDYEAFIMETRAIQENLHLGKLVIIITLAYLILQGPYIVLCFLVQIKNSDAFLRNNQEYEVPQDADTLITWVRFFYPLIFPLIIFASCHDIWAKFVNLTCCRRSTTGSAGTWNSNGLSRPKSSTPMISNDVLTLVATSEGLQLRVPEGNQMYQRQMMQKQINDAPAPNTTSMYGNVENIRLSSNSTAETDSSEANQSKKKNLVKRPKVKQSNVKQLSKDNRWKY